MSKATHTAWETIEEGIRSYKHLTRKHGVKPDQYFAIRYRVDGKRIDNGLGWASQGWTLDKARIELAKLRIAKATGEGEVTLQEKRTKAAAAREAEQAKPTIARLWEIYQQAKGDYANKATDTSNFRHFTALHKRTPDTIKTHEIATIAKELDTKGKKPQTIRNTLELLRRLVNFGAKQELCTRPAGLRFNMPDVDNVKTECLTPAQGKALMDALDKEPDQNLANLVRLALATGMRRGALLGLQWADIDFRQGIIVLRGEHAKKGRTGHLPMTTAARAILENIERTASPYIFYGKDGGKRVEVRRFTQRIRHEAGLPDDFRPLHGLRHTYASWLASSGNVTLLELQKLLTHESPAMTMRYAHLADTALRKAASVIDQCLDIAANAEPARPVGAKVVQFTGKA